MVTTLKGGADKYVFRKNWPAVKEISHSPITTSRLPQRHFFLTYVSRYGQEVRFTGGGWTRAHARIRMDLLYSDEVGSKLILETPMTDELTVYE
jgi:hypothetical protein